MHRSTHFDQFLTDCWNLVPPNHPKFLHNFMQPAVFLNYFIPKANYHLQMGSSTAEGMFVCIIAKWNNSELKFCIIGIKPFIHTRLLFHNWRSLLTTALTTGREKHDLATLSLCWMKTEYQLAYEWKSPDKNAVHRTSKNFEHLCL